MTDIQIHTHTGIGQIVHSAEATTKENLVHSLHDIGVNI